MIATLLVLMLLFVPAAAASKGVSSNTCLSPYPWELPMAVRPGSRASYGDPALAAYTPEELARHRFRFLYEDFGMAPTKRGRRPLATSNSWYFSHSESSPQNALRIFDRIGAAYDAAGVPRPVVVLPDRYDLAQGPEIDYDPDAPGAIPGLGEFDLAWLRPSATPWTGANSTTAFFEDSTEAYCTGAPTTGCGVTWSIESVPFNAIHSWDSPLGDGGSDDDVAGNYSQTLRAVIERKGGDPTDYVYYTARGVPGRWLYPTAALTKIWEPAYQAWMRTYLLHTKATLAAHGYPDVAVMIPNKLFQHQPTYACGGQPPQPWGERRDFWVGTQICGHDARWSNPDRVAAVEAMDDTIWTGEPGDIDGALEYSTWVKAYRDRAIADEAAGLSMFVETSVNWFSGCAFPLGPDYDDPGCDNDYNDPTPGTEPCEACLLREMAMKSSYVFLMRRTYDTNSGPGWSGAQQLAKLIDAERQNAKAPVYVGYTDGGETKQAGKLCSNPAEVNPPVKEHSYPYADAGADVTGFAGSDPVLSGAYSLVEGADATTGFAWTLDDPSVACAGASFSPSATAENPTLVVPNGNPGGTCRACLTVTANGLTSEKDCVQIKMIPQVDFFSAYSDYEFDPDHPHVTVAELNAAVAAHPSACFYWDNGPEVPGSEYNAEYVETYPLYRTAQPNLRMFASDRADAFPMRDVDETDDFYGYSHCAPYGSVNICDDWDGDYLGVTNDGAGGADGFNPAYVKKISRAHWDELITRYNDKDFCADFEPVSDPYGFTGVGSTSTSIVVTGVSSMNADYYEGWTLEIAYPGGTETRIIDSHTPCPSTCTFTIGNGAYPSGAPAEGLAVELRSHVWMGLKPSQSSMKADLCALVTATEAPALYASTQPGSSYISVAGAMFDVCNPSFRAWKIGMIMRSMTQQGFQANDPVGFFIGLKAGIHEYFDGASADPAGCAVSLAAGHHTWSGGPHPSVDATGAFCTGPGPIANTPWKRSEYSSCMNDFLVEMDTALAAVYSNYKIAVAEAPDYMDVPGMLLDERVLDNPNFAGELRSYFPLIP